MEARANPLNKEDTLIALLLLLLLLVILFGALGIFVAKLFFIALAVALVVSLLAGGGVLRGR